MDSYSFPVVSMVIATNGTVIHKMNANVLLDLSNKHNDKQSFLQAAFLDQVVEDPIGKVYEEFLNEGLVNKN